MTMPASTRELAAIDTWPSSARGVINRIERLGLPVVRREGSGGGFAVEVDALRAVDPAAAAAIEAMRAPKTIVIARPSQIELLSANYVDAPRFAREESERRMHLVMRVEQLVAELGISRRAAQDQVAEECGGDPAARTLRDWCARVNGHPSGTWLSRLLPRWKGSERVQWYPEEIYDLFRDRWLHTSKPTFKSVYREIAAIAAASGWSPMPSEATLRADVRRREQHGVVVYEREGDRALHDLYPHQERSVAHFHAMQWINTDGHKIDLFPVRFPDGELGRATLIGVQDVFSRGLVGRHLCKSETARAFGLAVHDVLTKYPIAKECTLLLDNTFSADARKLIGGSGKRRRGTRAQNAERDATGPKGLFTLAGFKIAKSLPYNGQAKPIERAWGFIAERVAKDPKFAGAYVGNKPENRPENHNGTPVEYADLLAVIDQEILRYNAQRGRRTEMARGVLSFDEVLHASLLANADKLHALTAEQTRILAQEFEVKRVRRDDACIYAFGNRYHHHELTNWLGKDVVIRFAADYTRLHEQISVYAPDGEQFLCNAGCIHAVGFDSVEDAQAHGRARSQEKRATKKVAAAIRRRKAIEIKAMVPTLQIPDIPLRDRPAFGLALPDSPNAAPTAPRVTRPSLGALADANRKPERPRLTLPQADLPRRKAGGSRL